MATADLLLSELEMEARNTRASLERVPADQVDFKPNPKSTPLGKLASHVAQLGGFGVIILTEPGLDFAAGKLKPLVYESTPQIVAAFNEGTAQVAEALRKLPENAWTEPWKLSFQEKVFFSGTRFNAYRAMFLNHGVHHRAQLGVYLRLLGVPVPSIYGPSADES